MLLQGDSCKANFIPGWGAIAYVTWFSVSNFFVPLSILLFCYVRICYVIWDNAKSKSSPEGSGSVSDPRAGNFDRQEEEEVRKSLQSLHI